MGSTASVVESSSSRDGTSNDNERKEKIMSKKGRLTLDDIQELCALEEHQDPSKHLFYGQIFNTLKEWDREGGVDCQKLLFLTSDICEREVLQLFLTFCDGKMDRVQFLEFSKRTKLFLIPVICEKKNEEVSRVINKLCWIDYSHYTPDPVTEGNERIRTLTDEDAAEQEGSQEKGEEEGAIRRSISKGIIQRSISDVANQVSSTADVVKAVTTIQRMQRGRQAQQLVVRERALHSMHNSPLSHQMKAALASMDKGGKNDSNNDTSNENGNASNGGLGGDSPHDDRRDAFSPSSKTPAAAAGGGGGTGTPVTSSKKQLALNRDYSEFDLKRATSREFSLKSSRDYSIGSLLFSSSKKEDAARQKEKEEVVEPPAVVERAEEREDGKNNKTTSMSLQTNLAHIIGEYHHRLDYSPYREGKRSKNDQHKNEIQRIAREREREREREKDAQQKTLSPNVRPTTPTHSSISPNNSSSSSCSITGPPMAAVKCPADMPGTDSPEGEAIRCIFTKFAPSGEMTVNDFVKFCYATVLIPFNPPIDFTGSQARFLFRRVIAECFNPEENTYVKGVLFGKRVVFDIFWALMVPGIALTKGVSSQAVVDFLHGHVSHDQLRRLYTAEDGPPLISLLSTQAGMASDCSSFKSNDADLQVNC